MTQNVPTPENTPSYGTLPPAPAAGPYEPASDGKNTIALVSMILGIVACACIFMFVFAAPLLGIVALVLGIVGIRRVKRVNAGKGFALTGIITGSVATALGAIFSIIAILALSVIGQAASEINDKTKALTTPASFTIQASTTEGDDASLTYSHLGNVLYSGQGIDDSLFDGENGGNGMGDAFTTEHSVDLKGYRGDTLRVTVNADYVNSPNAEVACKILMDGKVVSAKTATGSVTCQYVGN